jgi:ribosomal protein L34
VEDDALWLLENARAEAFGRRDLPREQVAWFQLRMGASSGRTIVATSRRRGRCSSAKYASAPMSTATDQLVSHHAKAEIFPQTGHIIFGVALGLTFLKLSRAGAPVS